MFVGEVWSQSSKWYQTWDDQLLYSRENGVRWAVILYRKPMGSVLVVWILQGSNLMWNRYQCTVQIGIVAWSYFVKLSFLFHFNNHHYSNDIKSKVWLKWSSCLDVRSSCVYCMQLLKGGCANFDMCIFTRNWLTLTHETHWAVSSNSFLSVLLPLVM